jgi:zinc D-Ala-D-Ala dipeptidase
MTWLVDCAAVAVPPQPGLPAVRPPALACPDAPVEECDEPLIPLAGLLAAWPVYSWLGFRHFASELRLRAGVVERIWRAARRLPPDFDIVVLDAHRTRELQAELLAYYQARTVPAGDYSDFVADPWSSTPVPPHTTGGAADLTLSWRGAALGLGTDFDAFVPEAAPAALEGGPGAAANGRDGRGAPTDLRRLLASVLQAEGMTVLPSEWWHWSYGDQHWAAQAGEPVAIYGEIT